MDIVRGEIAAARAELESIARKARFARVSVAVEGDGGTTMAGRSATPPTTRSTCCGRSPASPSSASPCCSRLLLGAVAWLVFRGAARRRRERALD